ncbi:MAG: rubredoxin [Niabella sp.]
MKGYCTIKINFKGGIVSPGDLLDILNEASMNGVAEVSFGLRQQLLIDVEEGLAERVEKALDRLGVFYETDKDDYPNIVSSYPAEEVFINNTWLSEGVYKDILDELDYHPQLKINISDSNQSFTPLLTGNINWVASPQAPHFWHLFIRLPKSNSIFEWNEMVYSNDVARLSKEIENVIFDYRLLPGERTDALGDNLLDQIPKDGYITRQANGRLLLPDFNLPYYEGFNRYDNKYWLGVYRRSEMFPVSFLKGVCRLCLDTKLGHLCSTPWKSIIIKGIEEKNKHLWSALLDQHSINMRHAANELNFQVQDNDHAARKLKHDLVRKLNDLDARTFGICIGIKTKKKSEIFSTILIRRKPMVKIFGKEFFHLYDILCAKDFNPNARTGTVFVSNITRLYLAEELRRAIGWFYKKKEENVMEQLQETAVKEKIKQEGSASVYQCSQCLSVYDSWYGDPENDVAAGTGFQQLPADYSCPVCDAAKENFSKIDKAALFFVAS